MKKKIIFMLVGIILVLTVFLTACNESTKQDSIPTDFSDKTVTSNGGLAVTYGKYLYFVNGFAGEAALNTFGDVVKGAVARVELDESKLPKKGTEQIIVPKNVYFSAEGVTAGIFIYNDYIYYATTSVEKDGDGNYKTSEMVVMRTKVDGSGTETVKEFSSHSAIYRVKNNSMLYVDGNKLVRIDLDSKKFKETVVEETIGTTYFFTSPTGAGMDNYLIYTTTVDSKTFVKAVEVDGSAEPKVILSDEIIGGNITYTITPLKVVQQSDKLAVFYKITDSEPNTHSLGIYYYLYDSTFAVDKDSWASKKIRLTQNDNATVGLNYSDFYFFNNKIISVATKTDGSATVSKFDMFNLDGTNKTELIPFSATVTVDKMYIEDDALYCYYTADSKLYKIQFASVDGDGNILAVEKNAVVYFEGTIASSAWATKEIIGSIMYFWNGSINNTAYYLDLSKVVERDADSKKPTLLGILTDADRIAAF